MSGYALDLRQLEIAVRNHNQRYFVNSHALMTAGILPCRRCHGDGNYHTYGTCYRCGGTGREPSNSGRMSTRARTKLVPVLRANRVGIALVAALHPLKGSWQGLANIVAATRQVHESQPRGAPQ